MTARADVAAATDSQAGPRWSYPAAGSHAGLPARPYTGRDPRTTSHRIDRDTAANWRYQQ